MSIKDPLRFQTAKLLCTFRGATARDGRVHRTEVTCPSSSSRLAAQWLLNGSVFDMRTDFRFLPTDTERALECPGLGFSGEQAEAPQGARSSSVPRAVPSDTTPFFYF